MLLQSYMLFCLRLFLCLPFSSLISNLVLLGKKSLEPTDILSLLPSRPNVFRSHWTDYSPYFLSLSLPSLQHFLKMPLQDHCWPGGVWSSTHFYASFSSTSPEHKHCCFWVLDSSAAQISKSVSRFVQIFLCTVLAFTSIFPSQTPVVITFPNHFQQE